MDELVENEAKLHITNGIEKASGANGVDIMVSARGKNEKQICQKLKRAFANTRFLIFVTTGSMQNRERTNG